MRGDPALDQSPDLIDHGGIKPASVVVPAVCLRASRPAAAAAALAALKATSFRQWVYALASRLTEGRCGTTSSRSTYRKILPEKCLFEGLGGRVVADHRCPEGDDLVHGEEVALEPPRGQECERSPKAMASDPERPFLGL